MHGSPKKKPHQPAKRKNKNQQNLAEKNAENELQEQNKETINKTLDIIWSENPNTWTEIITKLHDSPENNQGKQEITKNIKLMINAQRIQTNQRKGRPEIAPIPAQGRNKENAEIASSHKYMNRAIDEAIKRTPNINNGYDYSKIEKQITNTDAGKKRESEIRKMLIATLIIRDQNGISEYERENGAITKTKSNN